jgi:hypothetical protein
MIEMFTICLGMSSLFNVSQVFYNLEGKVTANKWFLPLVWASDITSRAMEEGKIK